MSTAAHTPRPIVSPVAPRAFSGIWRGKARADDRPGQIAQEVLLATDDRGRRRHRNWCGLALGAAKVPAPVMTRFVTFKVLAPQTSSTEIATGKDTQEKPLERFMSTQAQTMVSDKVLNKALGYPGFQSNAPDWIAQFTDANGAGLEHRCGP